MQLNKTLASEQQSLREKYDEVNVYDEFRMIYRHNIEIVVEHLFENRFKFQCIAIRADLVTKKSELTEQIEKLHLEISTLCPNKTLTSIDNIIAQHGNISMGQFEY